MLSGRIAILSLGFDPVPRACFCSAKTPTTVNTCPSTRTSWLIGIFTLGEERFGRIVAQDDDGGVMLLVRIVEEASALEVEIADLDDGRRVALQDDVGGAVVAAAHGARPDSYVEILNVCERGSRHHVRQPSETVRPFRFELLALQHRRRLPAESRKRKAVADDRARTERLDRIKHVGIQAVDDGADHDDRGYTNHDAQDGEKRAERIPHDDVERQRKRFFEISRPRGFEHDSTFFLPI